MAAEVSATRIFTTRYIMAPAIIIAGIGFAAFKAHMYLRAQNDTRSSKYAELQTYRNQKKVTEAKLKTSKTIMSPVLSPFMQEMNTRKKMQNYIAKAKQQYKERIIFRRSEETENNFAASLQLKEAEIKQQSFVLLGDEASIYDFLLSFETAFPNVILTNVVENDNLVTPSLKLEKTPVEVQANYGIINLKPKFQTKDMETFGKDLIK